MRVLLVSANFRPHLGGIERFTEILATNLAGRGHQVAVLCCRSHGAPLREEIDGYSVERVPATYVLERRLGVPYPLPAPWRLLSSLRRLMTEADLVHVQDVLYASSLPGLLLARHRGIASVLTQHVGFVPQHTKPLDALERIALFTLGRCARLATGVATYNAAVGDWISNSLGVRDVHVLPVGVPAPHPLPGDRFAIRDAFGLPRDRFLALFVGRDVPKKGLDVFLAAADPAYTLVAVTDRTDRTDRSPRLAMMLPFMSPDRLQELLSCVDSFVLPSEGEGFPLSLQEALVHGLAVVTTEQPGYEKYLMPDDVLFVRRHPQAVRDALRRLTTDDLLRRKLQERARAVGRRHFGVEAFVSAYEEFYDEARRRVSVRH